MASISAAMGAQKQAAIDRESPSPKVEPPRVRPKPAPPPPSLLAKLRERMQEQASREEWEAIVGGSWLNKVGVFVLVIGLALFLGYSFTMLGPAGRIAIGFVLSAAILIG